MAFEAGTGQAPYHDESIGGDTMLWYARAIWRSRWFFCAAMLAGCVWGTISAALQPGFQTVCMFREMNPVINHLHRGYWESIGRATTSQLSMLAEAEGQQFSVSVKAEADPWMQRMEIRHHKSGEGRTIAERIHAKLQEQSRAYQAETGLTVAGEMLPERTQLTEVLKSLDAAVRETLEELKLPAISADQVATESSEFLTIAPQMIDRLPFEYLPGLRRIRDLQAAALNLLTGTANLPEQRQRQLQQLVDQSTAALLEYWVRMDVFVLAAHRNRVEMDVVFESPTNRLRELSTRTVLGAMLAGLVAVIAIVPWIWATDYWEKITSGRVG